MPPSLSPAGTGPGAVGLGLPGSSDQGYGDFSAGAVPSWGPTAVCELLGAGRTGSHSLANRDGRHSWGGRIREGSQVWGAAGQHGPSGVKSNGCVGAPHPLLRGGASSPGRAPPSREGAGASRTLAKTGCAPAGAWVWAGAPETQVPSSERGALAVPGGPAVPARSGSALGAWGSAWVLFSPRRWALACAIRSPRAAWVREPQPFVTLALCCPPPAPPSKAGFGCPASLRSPSHTH